MFLGVEVFHGSMDRTVSGVHLGQGTGSFAHHDGDGRVVLLHCGVSSNEEVSTIPSAFFSLLWFLLILVMLRT